MIADKPIKKTIDTLMIFGGLAIMLAIPINAYAATTQEAPLTIESPKVCSPGSHSICMPGPFTVNVSVPEGVIGGQIEVYWSWTGSPGQVQPNEHSWFTAAVNGVQVDRVFCPDFGDEVVEHQLCGSTTFQAAEGVTMSLTIQHADEERGPTPGSHRQIWVIHWEVIEPTPPIPVPTIMVDTPTPTMEAPTPTPTEAPITPVAPTPTVGTPTAVPTLPPPQPVSTLQPVLLPVTGADSGLSQELVDLSLRVLAKAGLLVFGLALVIIGIRRGLR